MDNPEKLATWGTQDEDKQSKNTTHYVLDTTILLSSIAMNSSCLIRTAKLSTMLDDKLK